MKLDSPPVDPRIRRTRQMLFDAFAMLLAERSFEAISVQDIAERSTVNRATFYDHFSDKFALLDEMIGERFQTMFATRMAGTDGGCEEGLKQLVLAVCDFLSLLSTCCQKSQRQFEPMVEAKIKAIVRGFLLQGLQLHDPSTNAPELRATMASWAICGAALEWSRTQGSSAEALADSVLPLVLPVLANT